jgi:hypothetical protein
LQPGIDAVIAHLGRADPVFDVGCEEFRYGYLIGSRRDSVWARHWLRRRGFPRQQPRRPRKPIEDTVVFLDH